MIRWLSPNGLTNLFQILGIEQRDIDTLRCVIVLYYCFIYFSSEIYYAKFSYRHCLTGRVFIHILKKKKKKKTL